MYWHMRCAWIRFASWLVGPDCWLLPVRPRREQVLSGFLAGAALTLSSSAQAVTPVDLIDDRKAIKAGFDIIYEARDLALPQNVRDGFTQARQSLDDTKKRVKESEARLDTKIKPSIDKAYWTEAREELRRQVGYLRFDLNTLADAKPGKAEKKKAQELRKDFIAKVEALDLALRQKNQKTAASNLEAAEKALDEVLAFVL